MSKNQFRDLFESKVGYDFANKKMMCRVYSPLYNLIEKAPKEFNRSWTNVIRLMFINDGENLNDLKVSINGYYNRIKSNLKDIDVIRYEGRNLVKGSNWDRFYSDENWDWFITNTGSGEHAKIVK